jgi:hypothetical protein
LHSHRKIFVDAASYLNGVRHENKHGQATVEEIKKPQRTETEEIRWNLAVTNTGQEMGIMTEDYLS